MLRVDFWLSPAIQFSWTKIKIVCENYLGKGSGEMCKFAASEGRDGEEFLKRDMGDRGWGPDLQRREIVKV